MCARHGRLIYCELSAFGPYRPRPPASGYEPLLQAYSGLSASMAARATRRSGWEPSLSDQGTGMWAVIGALALLQRRHVTGRGGIVNVSLLEDGAELGRLEDRCADEPGSAARTPPFRPSDFVPYEAFEAQDGPFLICVGNDRLFVKLCAVLGTPGWPSDPWFADNRARLANRTLLVEADGPNSHPATDVGTGCRRWLRPASPCAPIHSLAEGVGATAGAGRSASSRPCLARILR